MLYTSTGSLLTNMLCTYCSFYIHLISNSVLDIRQCNLHVLENNVLEFSKQTQVDDFAFQFHCFMYNSIRTKPKLISNMAPCLFLNNDITDKIDVFTSTLAQLIEM